MAELDLRRLAKFVSVRAMKFRRAVILPLIASLIVLFGTVHGVQHELALYEVHDEVHDEVHHEVSHNAHHEDGDEDHHDDNCLLADINGGEAKLAAIIVPALPTKPQAQRLYAAPQTAPIRSSYARGPPTRL